ncbi:MAG: alpha/beta hydrolase [Propionibacteriaceae bacterium]|jgi:acetyl esterase|nr:alpha/beta hydrolase [Propionibacteriaceae bacterium]
MDNLSYSPELADLIAWSAARMPQPGAFPATKPAAGQTTTQWLQEVATIRARHDAAALTAGALAVAVYPPNPEEWANIASQFVTVEVTGGCIGARVYTPQGSGPFPAVVLIHGGAYWMGGGAAGFQLNDALCRQLVAEAGAVVVNVDHRLAPEYPYPVPLEDTYQTLQWVVAHAGEYEVDVARLAVFGISSGGNLACAAAQLAVDRGELHIAAQVLQCPSLDLALSSQRFSADALTVEAATLIAGMYSGGADTALAPLSPARRADLSSTPATLVVVAEFDALAPDALRYVDRLRQAQVPVEVHSYPMTHTVATAEVFGAMHRDTTAWLKGVFAQLALKTDAVQQK